MRLLVPGHFYFYAVSKFLPRENDISVSLLQSIITPLNSESQFVCFRLCYESYDDFEVDRQFDRFQVI